MASSDKPKSRKITFDHTSTKYFVSTKIVSMLNTCQYTPSIVTRKCFGDRLLKMRCAVVSGIIFGKTFDGEDEKSGN